MPVTDPIADFLTRMRNAQKSGRPQCRCPLSAHKKRVCEVLLEKGLIADMAVEGDGCDKEIVVTFGANHPSLEIKRISKPGRRVYIGKGDIKPVLRGFGVSILSTSGGIMTGEQARKNGVGGEVICTVS